MNPANKILKQIAMKFTSILIGLLLCSYSFGMNINHLNNYNFNEIKIKIKGNGLQKICEDPIPIEIYLYNKTHGFTKKWGGINTLTLDDEESTLLLKFNQPMNAAGLFLNMENITYIDVSNCVFSDMASMFKGCTSLISIKFSGINTNAVQDMVNLFYNCKSLISLDLSDFDFSNGYDFENMFYGCTSLQYINLQNYVEKTGYLDPKIEISNDILSNLVICITKEKAPNLNDLINLAKCTSIYCRENWKEKRLKYDEELESCIENTDTDEINYQPEEGVQKSEKEEESNSEYYENNEEEKINNENDNNEEENENEEEENDNNIEIQETYKDTLTDIINEKYENEIHDDMIKDFFIDNLFNKTENKTEMKNIIDNMKKAIERGEFKEFIEKNNKTELVQKKDDKYYQVSTLSSQLDNNEVASINLGDCEAKLRNQSNISPDEDLIIFKINHIIPETNTQILEYTIFTMDGIELNLDICKDSKIQYNIPLDITEKDLYKYDPNSDFYKDICFQYTSESGTDMTNYDRKNQFNEKNMALCENDCEYKEYDKDDKKVICDCKVKNIFNTLDEIDKGKLLKKFSNFKSIFNFEVIKCLKLLFSIKGLKYNIGSYITLSIILIHLINIIIFGLKGYYLFFDRINIITEHNLNNDIDVKNKDFKKSINITNLNKTKTMKSKKNKIKSSPPKARHNNKSKTHNKKKSHNRQMSISKDINLSKNVIYNNSDTSEKINKNIIERNDYEMNSLSYEEAQKYDYRNFYEYYSSLIRTKQLIFFTFFTKSDYNSRIIKINTFFTSFALYYAVKALFFNDEVMHTIYQNQGVYDFIFQLPQIIYSTIISAIIGVILSKLSLTQSKIVEIRNSIKKRNSIEYKKKLNGFIKCIKIQFVLFFVINFLLLLLFWYYLSCFCAVYKNTQVYLIKDVLISFGISLIYPFIINIFPGILRIISLKERNNNHKYTYILSKILQII